MTDEDKDIFSSDDDYMEIGNTGKVPVGEGWYEDRWNKTRIDPSGRVYDTEGELIFDPEEDDDRFYDDEDYEWYHDE